MNTITIELSKGKEAIVIIPHNITSDDAELILNKLIKINADFDLLPKLIMN